MRRTSTRLEWLRARSQVCIDEHKILCLHKGSAKEGIRRAQGRAATTGYCGAEAALRRLRPITNITFHDITQAQALVNELCADYLIADKGYDAAPFVLKLKEHNSEAVIPSRSNRKEQREIETHLYKERHLIENQIGKLKQFRRVFSRFDKLAKNYLSFIYLASTVVWLR